MHGSHLNPILCKSTSVGLVPSPLKLAHNRHDLIERKDFAGEHF